MNNLTVLPQRDFQQLEFCTDVLAAWAAGFFDGDGSVGVYRSTQKGNYLMLDVSFTQAGHMEPRVLRILKDRWGGRIRKAGKRKPGQRQAWQWKVTAAAAERFLRDVAPFVIGKVERVQLALEYRDRALRDVVLAEEYRHRLAALIERPVDKAVA